MQMEVRFDGDSDVVFDVGAARCQVWHEDVE